MKPVADVTLRWFDDTTLLADEPRKLVEVFLEALGITSDVARDLMEILLAQCAKDHPLTTQEIKERILELRGERGQEVKGLTDRNLQVWLKYFREIRLADRVGGRHRFTGNKTPLAAFKENTRPVIDDTLNYIQRALEKLEDAYGIKTRD